MKVSDAMTRDVRVASPDATLQQAADIMARLNAGALPVGENDKLVGMISDRDIAIRAVGAGKGPDTPVREVMSREVKYCYEDDELFEVAQNMADIKVRRLPVLDRDKRLIHVDVSTKELAARRKKWKAPKARYKDGILAEYARHVSSAAEGAIVE